MEGWRWSAVHHPDELERVTEIWTKAIAAGKAVELTFPPKSKDGSYRPFLTGVVPIRDASGAVIRWIGTDVDISAQVATEERLREAERNWRNLFDEMQEGFAVIEFERDHFGEAVDAIVVKVNRQWEAHTGLPTDQVIGRRAITVAAENRLERAKIYADVVATGNPRKFEVHDGSIGRTFEISAYRYSPTQCAILFTDISARKFAEQEARLAQNNLLRVSRLSAMGAIGVDPGALVKPATGCRRQLHRCRERAYQALARRGQGPAVAVAGKHQRELPQGRADHPQHARVRRHRKSDQDT